MILCEYSRQEEQINEYGIILKCFLHRGLSFPSDAVPDLLRNTSAIWGGSAKECIHCALLLLVGQIIIGVIAIYTIVAVFRFNKDIALLPDEPSLALPSLCRVPSQEVPASGAEYPATRNRTRDHLIPADSTVRCSTN